MTLPKLKDLQDKYKSKGDKKKGEKGKTVTTTKTRGRTSKSELHKTQREKALEEKEKDELLDIFLSENKGKPLDKIIPILFKYSNGKGGKKTGRTTSSLSGIRKTLEDYLNIDQLVTLIRKMRGARNGNGEETGKESGSNGGNAMGMLTSLLPLLTNMQDGGQDEIGTLQLLQMMNNMGGSAGDDMGAFGMQLLLTKVLSQINNSKGGNNNSVDPNMISNLVNQFQQMMDKQKSSNNFFDDPTSIMQMKLMNKILNEDSQSTNQIIDKLSRMYEDTKNNKIETILQRQDYKFQKMIETLSQRLAPQNDMNKFMKFLNIYEKIKGEDKGTGEMSDTELEWRLKNRELDLEEARLNHELSKDKYESEVESKKSLEVIKGGLSILDNFLGEGNLGTFLDMLGNKRGGNNSRSARSSTPQRQKPAPRGRPSQQASQPQQTENVANKKNINLNKLKEL